MQRDNTPTTCFVKLKLPSHLAHQLVTVRLEYLTGSIFLEDDHYHFTPGNFTKA